MSLYWRGPCEGISVGDSVTLLPHEMDAVRNNKCREWHKENIINYADNIGILLYSAIDGGEEKVIADVGRLVSALQIVVINAAVAHGVDTPALENVDGNSSSMVVKTLCATGEILTDGFLDIVSVDELIEIDCGVIRLQDYLIFDDDRDKLIGEIQFAI